MITSESTAEYEKKGYEYGIVSYIKKPFYDDVIRHLVDNVVEVFQYKTQLEITVKKQTEKLQKQNTMLKLLAEKQKNMNEVLINSLSNIVEFRNLEKNPGAFPVPGNQRDEAVPGIWPHRGKAGAHRKGICTA